MSLRSLWKAWGLIGSRIRPFHLGTTNRIVIGNDFLVGFNQLHKDESSVLVRAVIQRVTEASVTVEGEVVGKIERGFLVLLGVAADDKQEDADWVASKIAGLRVFEDSEGKMNLDLADIGGAVLLVSQFTLYGDCRKGRRPSFVEAARPEAANDLYLFVASRLRSLGLPVETGTFQAHMDVRLLNDGPVTLLLDSRRTF